MTGINVEALIIKLMEEGIPSEPATTIANAINEGNVAWTNSQATIERTSETGAGAVAENAYSVSILNVGSASGTVDGVSIVEGQSINLTALEDQVTRELKLLPEIEFDATGTTLSITVIR